MRVCDLVDVSLRGIFNMQQKIIYSPQMDHNLQAIASHTSQLKPIKID